MESITGAYGNIHFGTTGYSAMNAHIRSRNYSIIFILVDSNTHEHCLSYFMSRIETESPIEIIEIEAGEAYKTLETCQGVWEAMSELGGDRKSLMINLGGGVVTDLGGFVASAFKRGIDFINVPTSLLAMVDASIGGKTGVDLGGLKNQIGVINMGTMVVVDVEYLKTLPPKEMRSGSAEMFKHGLIADPAYWEAMKVRELDVGAELNKLVYSSIGIKYSIVKEDPTEQSIRKALNFGHTLGHAIETFFLLDESRESLLHGEAIAIGMIMEAFLSQQILGLDDDSIEDIRSVLSSHFGKVDISEDMEADIIELLKHDKKNTHGQINFVLLDKIGSFKLDQQAGQQLLHRAFSYYRS